MSTITIKRSDCVRGLTFLPQQYGGTVPAGAYDVHPVREIRYSDLGRPMTSPAVLIVNQKTGAEWFVAPAVADRLVGRAEFDVTRGHANYVIPRV